MDFLTALRQGIEITVRPTRKEHGQVSIFLLDSGDRPARMGSLAANVKGKDAPHASPFRFSDRIRNRYRSLGCTEQSADRRLMRLRWLPYILWLYVLLHAYVVNSTVIF